MQKVYLRSYDTEENLWIFCLVKRKWSTVQVLLDSSPISLASIGNQHDLCQPTHGV